MQDDAIKAEWLGEPPEMKNWKLHGGHVAALSPVISTTTIESVPVKLKRGGLDMKRKRYSEEKIIGALQRHEAGVALPAGSGER